MECQESSSIEKKLVENNGFHGKPGFAGAKERGEKDCINKKQHEKTRVGSTKRSEKLAKAKNKAV